MFSRHNPTTRTVEQEDGVLCPACSEVLADDMDEYALDDTESVEISCPHCDESIEVTARTVICYIAKVAD